MKIIELRVHIAKLLIQVQIPYFVDFTSHTSKGISCFQFSRKKTLQTIFFFEIVSTLLRTDQVVTWTAEHA